MACKTDPAMEVIEALVVALTDAFTGTQCPPKVGNVEVVRLFAGDAIPMSAWDSHASQSCDSPFVWIRAMRRYRSVEFPAPTVDIRPCSCDLTRVIAIEVGVGWCTAVDQEPDWSTYAAEALESTDAAWRLERAMTNASAALQMSDDARLVGLDMLVPYGPEGGVTAWTGILYSSYPKE